MAKRKRKEKMSDEELAQIEADRLEAHGEAAVMETAEFRPVELVKEPEFVTEFDNMKPVEGSFPAPSDEELDKLKEASDEADVEEDIAKPNSVVAVKFEVKYLENAELLGIKGKAAKRSNWDWLSQQIAAICLDEKHKISIPRFTRLMDANNIDYSRWTNRNKGWEGRYRMTGRVALQKVVADAGVLRTFEGEDRIPPADFIEKFKSKV